VFVRVNAKCAHEARPPLTGNKRLPEIGKPWATCATDPDNAVRFVSRADAEMASSAFRLNFRLPVGFGMLTLSGRHDASRHVRQARASAVKRGKEGYDA
jgi:hypothetical protein